jgi:hypothetical protein
MVKQTASKKAGGKSRDNEPKFQLRACPPDPRDEHGDPDARAWADVEVVGDTRKYAFPSRITVHEHTMEDAIMTIDSNGTCHWEAFPFSTTSNVSWGAKFFFYDHNSLLLFEWPRIYSPTLRRTRTRWKRDNLAVPEAHVRFITRVVGEWYT